MIPISPSTRANVWFMVPVAVNTVVAYHVPTYWRTCQSTATVNAPGQERPT